MQVREKVKKLRNTVFFQWFVAPEGRKVGSLKRRVRSHLARWEMKNCTPLWREARFEVKMHTKHYSCSEHFWKLRCRKSARRCGAKHISKSKCKKCGAKALLDVQMSFCVAGARDSAPCQKWAKREGFVAVSKTLAGVGHLKRICKDAFCVAGAAQARDMFIRDVRRSGRSFPERGCILEHQIFRFAKMILRDRCSTSCDLASLFRGRRSTLDRWSGKIAKRIGTEAVSSALNFPFLKEVSQNCFVFDVVNFRKLRTVSQNRLRFLTLSSSNIKEVSQNCCIFDSCQVQNLRKVSQNRLSFSSLHKD